MGISAYRRGSAVISRDICRKYGCRGCANCKDYTPTPRPPDWGSKTVAKAADKGRKLLRGAARMGRTAPSLDDLADMIGYDTRWSRGSCLKGAAIALDIEPHTDA